MKQFFYNAGAFAVGGTITRINGKVPERPLIVQAPALLPFSGGLSVGRIGRTDECKNETKGFHYGRVESPDAQWVITIGSADTDVAGTQDGDCYVTKATNIITDLNVLGRIEAARIVMEAESRHCLSDGGRGARFHVTKAVFDGLRIDGVLLRPERSERFGRGRTFSELVAGQDAARRPGTLGGLSMDRQLLLTSIFAPVGEDKLDELQKANKHPEAGSFELLPDNGIHVPDFGNVYFGRCLINREKRETVMLHLELGSPVKGPIDIGGEFGNGLPFP